ncbi:MAG: hypothetical protein ABW321_11010, partial [Polyangiales bacterium]
GLGFLCGVAVVLAIPGPDDVLTRAQPRELAMAVSVVPLFIECAPVLLLGMFAASLLGWLCLPLRAAGMTTPSLLVQALRGLVLGSHPLPTSIGLPLSAAGVAQPLSAATVANDPGSSPAPTLARRLTVMAAAGLGVDALLLSYRLLGGTVAIGLWLGGCTLVLAAACASAMAARAGRASTTASPDLVAATRVAPMRQPAQLPAAILGWVDRHAAQVLLGLLLATVLEAGVAPDLLVEVPVPAACLLAVGLAAPGYLGALGALPVAAVLLHKGAPVGAVATFAWLAPVASRVSIQHLRERCGRRAAHIFLGAGVLLAVLLGFIADAVLSTGGVPAVHPLITHVHAPWEPACALVLASLLLLSLLRQGPRRFVGQLLPHRCHTPGHAHATQLDLSSTPVPAANQVISEPGGVVITLSRSRQLGQRRHR